MTITSVRYGGPKLQPSTATHATDAGPLRDLLALVGVRLRANGAVSMRSPVSKRACYTALARLEELESDEARRTVCDYVGEAAGVLCLKSGSLWTPLLDAVSDAYVLRCGSDAARLGAPALRNVAHALASALCQRDDSRLALRLLRRWRSPVVHAAVLQVGLRRVTPALERAVLALPSTSIAELSRVLHSRTTDWQQLLEAARRELLRRLELIHPTSADAHALVGALAEVTVACADVEHPLSRAVRATGWKTQLGVSGVTAGAPSPAVRDYATTADDLRQLSRAVPDPDSASARRPLWDERTLRAIQRVVDSSDGRTSPLELHSGDPGLGIHTWLALALRQPITPTDARNLVQVARPYASWRPIGYVQDGVPPVLALLARESIPDAVVVQVARTLSAAEWTAAVPALVRRSAVRTEPALRERLACVDSARVQAVLALDEPIATLGDLLRALIDRDPDYAMAAIDARPDATQVLRQRDLLPLLRHPTGSVRRNAATLLHRLQA